MVDGAVMNCAYKRTHFRPGDKTKETTKNPKRKKGNFSVWKIDL